MKVLPDLWDGCYEGEHRKLLSPEQFKQMFCGVCLNPGCRNSRGAGSKWTQRMLTQEDRLLNNPQFAPENAAAVLGIPDFKDMVHQALALEISDKRGDWEVVSEADVGRAAAELVGVVPAPSGFQPDNDPVDPTTMIPEEEQELSHGEALPEPPDIEVEPQVSESTPAVSDPIRDSMEGHWRVRGDSRDQKGNNVIYDVTLYKDGSWECSCPSREDPCKHSRDIAAKLARAADMLPPTEPPANPTRPTKRPAPPRPSFNTNMPSGGVMVGSGPPPQPEVDPWAPPTGPKDRVIDVGGKITFGSGKKK